MSQRSRNGEDNVMLKMSGVMEGKIGFVFICSGIAILSLMAVFLHKPFGLVNMLFVTLAPVIIGTILVIHSGKRLTDNHLVQEST